MRPTGLLAPLSLILAACGCSGPPVKAEGEDAAEYARATRQQVLQFVKAAKESPRSAGGQAVGLLERLEVYPSRPVGENKAVYEQLTQKCKELIDAARRSPGSAEVVKMADEMAALAKKLPE
jgi:hypothetical protein